MLETHPSTWNCPFSFTILNNSSAVLVLFPVKRKCSSGTGLLVVLITWRGFFFVRLQKTKQDTILQGQLSIATHYAQDWSSTYPIQSANSIALGTVADNIIIPTWSGSIIKVSSHTTPRCTKGKTKAITKWVPSQLCLAKTQKGTRLAMHNQ